MTAQKTRFRYTTRLFKQQVAVFTIGTVVILAAILYFAFSKTIITITPAILSQSLSATLNVGPKPADQKTPGPDVTGTIVQTDISVHVDAQASPASGDGTPAKATGTVTIVNHWSKTQPLQAGTRLLSDNGILFRTTKRVDVPSGGSVETAVEADQPGKTGEIGPSHFEIVALWQGLKDKIYGQSTAAFTGGTSVSYIVTKDDLNTARQALGTEIENQGRAALLGQMQADPQTANLQLVALTHRLTMEDPGATVGEQRATFTYRATATMLGVVADNDEFIRQAQQKLQEALPPQRGLLATEQLSPVADFTENDVDQKNVTLTVHADAKVSVRPTSPIFDRSRLVNRSRASVLSYLSQYAEVKSATVRFSPFWIIRTPSLVDHIDIKFLQPVP